MKCKLAYSNANAWSRIYVPYKKKLLREEFIGKKLDNELKLVQVQIEKLKRAASRNELVLYVKKLWLLIIKIYNVMYNFLHIRKYERVYKDLNMVFVNIWSYLI